MSFFGFRWVWCEFHDHLVLFTFKVVEEQGGKSKIKIYAKTIHNFLDQVWAVDPKIATYLRDIQNRPQPERCTVRKLQVYKNWAKVWCWVTLFLIHMEYWYRKAWFPRGGWVGTLQRFVWVKSLTPFKWKKDNQALPGEMLTREYVIFSSCSPWI